MQRIVYLLALAMPMAGSACSTDDTTAAMTCYTGLTTPNVASASKDDLCKYLSDWAACYPTACCTDTVKQSMDTMKTTYKNAGYDCSFTCGETSGGTSGETSGTLRSAVPFIMPAVTLTTLVAGFFA